MHLFDYQRVLADLLRAPRFVRQVGETGPRVLVAPSVALPTSIVDNDSQCITRYNHNLSLPFKLQPIVFRDETFFVRPGTFIRASTNEYGVNPSFRFEEGAFGPERSGLRAPRIGDNALLRILPLAESDFNKSTPDYPAGSLRIVTGGDTIDVSNSAGQVAGGRLLVKSDVTICKSPNIMRFELTDSAGATGDENLYARASDRMRNGEYVRRTFVVQEPMRQMKATDATIEPGPGQPGGYPGTSNLMDYVVDESTNRPSTSASTSAADYIRNFTVDSTAANDDLQI